MADGISSPPGVTRAVSPVNGAVLDSLYSDLDMRRLQGPGESFDIIGDGRGVRSGIALSWGDDKAEFGAEPEYEFDPKLLARTCFILGVLAIGMAFEARRSWLVSDASNSSGREAKLLCTRNLVALTGLESELEAPECLCCVVLREDRVARGFNGAQTVGGGGEGAIVVEVKTRSSRAHCGSALTSCVSFWIFRGSS